MELKEYKNLNSLELEKYAAELLNSGIIKNEKQRAELENIIKELKKQNFLALMKKELKK